MFCKQGSTVWGKDKGVHQVVLLLLPGGVGANHEAYSLIEHVYLMRLQVLYGQGQLSEQL